MNTAAQEKPSKTPQDPDLVDQAQKGHGVPSQDPDPAAQTALAPADAEREANSALTGGGLVGGAAVGAAIGVALGGPVGVLLGSSVGAVAGALGAAAVRPLLSADEDKDKQELTDKAGPPQPKPGGARR